MNRGQGRGNDGSVHAGRGMIVGGRRSCATVPKQGDEGDNERG